MRSNGIKKSNYMITTVEQAKIVSRNFLKSIELEKAVDFGLPEIDDRFHIWRVPVKSKSNESIGEIVIDAFTTLINEKKTTKKEVLESRLLGRKNVVDIKNKKSETPKISNLRNTIGLELKTKIMNYRHSCIV